MRNVLARIFTKIKNVASIVRIFGRKNLNEKGFVCDNKRNRNLQEQFVTSRNRRSIYEGYYRSQKYTEI